MKIFVTGGTGFVGSYILKTFNEKGDLLKVLVREGSKPKLSVTSAEVVYGDVLEPKTLPKAMEGCDAIIHLVGIIREYPSKGVTFHALHYDATRHVVDAARRVGIKRFLHMSANGANLHGRTPYQTTKWAAEEYLKASNLDWTIFRPSVIFGDPFLNTEITTQMAEIIKKMPVVPVFGNGKYQLQPVAVEDVALAFSRSLDFNGTIGKTFQLCGPRILTYIEFLNEIGKALGKERVKTFSIPLRLIKPIVKALDRFAFLPVTHDQLTMLVEGNVCQDQLGWRALQIEPRGFEAKYLNYLIR